MYRPRLQSSGGGGIEIFLWLDLSSVPKLELDGRAPTGGTTL